MNILEISEEEFNKYKFLSEGFESKIYYNDKILIKKYYDLNEKKLSKIELFSKLLIPSLTLPNSLVKINNEVIGFTMDFQKGFYPIGNSKDLDISKKYEILKKLADLLTKLHENDIVYGDLSPNNIICDDEEIYLCDVVNSKIEDFDFNEYSSVMANYKYKDGPMDYRLDYYMLNLLTIYYLNNIEYDEVLNVVENTLVNLFNNKQTEYIIGISDNLECMNICYDMINPENTNNELLINHIDIEKYIENRIKF